MRMRSVVPAAIGSAFFAWLTVSGCSTTNVTQVTNCGVGTQLVNGTCVAVTTDAGGMGEADTGGSTSGDAGADAFDPNALLPGDDPCPAADAGTDTIVYNCDPKCGATHPDCEVSRCRKAGEGRETSMARFSKIQIGNEPMTPEGYKKNVILRLPRDPWTIYGECNSSLVPPLHPVAEQPLYQAMVPTPRWAFVVRALPPRVAIQGDRLFRFDPSPYAANLLTYRDINRTLPTVNAYPFDPLAGDSDIWRPTPDYSRPPCLYAAIGTHDWSWFSSVAIYTDAATVPAHNIRFEMFDGTDGPGGCK